MSSLAFVTHPSVRIKGSENAYSPVQCMDELCTIKTPHLHCPFCVKTDSYTDPVILKAHYRVKHVDKGIEFAGLKILRCCDHCDIVGVIKGEKKFKGAHWHCYRCRNGFNRRDEAIKHYKTHFRNPQTTFQISITQDLNNPVAFQAESKSTPTTPVSGSVPHSVGADIIHPALTEAIACISSPLTVTEQDMITNSAGSLSNGKLTSGLNISEVSDDDEGQQSIVIIQEEQQLETTETETDADTTYQVNIITENGDNGDKGVTDRRVLDIKAKLEQRLKQVAEERDALKMEVARLHRHVNKVEESLRQSRKREEELSARLGNATERVTADLLKSLECEHRALLRQHLDTLQNYILTSRSPTTSTVLQFTDQQGQEIQVVNASSLEALFGGSITTTTSSEGQTTLPTTTIIQTSDLSLEEVSANEAAEVVGGATVPVSSSEIELGTNYVMCVQQLKSEKGDEEEMVTVISDARSMSVVPSSSQTILSTASAAMATSLTEPPTKRRKAN